MDPKAYPIPNIEKYENPDLFPEKTKVRQRTRYVDQKCLYKKNVLNILASKVHSTRHIDEEFASSDS